METLIHLEDVRLPGVPADAGTGLGWTVRSGERWALWGPNGAGKSTLLAVLAGDVAATDGVVRRAPGLRLVRVGQDPRPDPSHTLARAAHHGLHELRRIEAATRDEERRLAEGAGDLARLAALNEAFERAGGWRARPRLERELAELLPGRDPATRVGALSSGERRRLALALALAAAPELLLLDEPTNGLDLETRVWLSRRLRSSDATLVVASHDRALLGALSTHSARMAGGALETVALPFDRDRAQRGVARRRARRRERELRSEADRLERAAVRAKRWGTPATSGAAAGLARRARAALDEVPEEAADGPRRGWSLAGSDAARGTILRATHLTTEAFDDLSLVLEAGDKVALLGRNGSGKSSLLAALAGTRPSTRADAEVWTPPRVRLHHWDARERGLGREPVREQLERWVSAPRAANLLALVGLPHERWGAAPRRLSGGERARAAVALTIAREPDLLLLDEPETDLDIVGLELLEAALAEARVTVLLATHDLRLAEAVCGEAWSIEAGELVAWRGGASGWASGRRRREPRAAAPVPPPVVPPDPEARLERLEDERLACERLLEDPARLPERERLRVRDRHARLVEALMAAYDARLAPPAPRFDALVPPLRLQADLAAAPGPQALTFRAPWPALPRVRVVDGVAHLQLPPPEDGAWLPWARAAALQACAHIVFTALYPRALQTPAVANEAPPAPFVAWDADWWVLTREAWERGEGFRP